MVHQKCGRYVLNFFFGHTVQGISVKWSVLSIRYANHLIDIFQTSGDLAFNGKRDHFPRYCQVSSQASNFDCYPISLEQKFLIKE